MKTNSMVRQCSRKIKHHCSPVIGVRMHTIQVLDQVVYTEMTGPMFSLLLQSHNVESSQIAGFQK
jgi:hypothetical protein